MNAKDAMIETYSKEEDKEYRPWLDWVDRQQEWVSRLIEQGHIPIHKETYHAEVQH